MKKIVACFLMPALLILCAGCGSDTTIRPLETAQIGCLLGSVNEEFLQNTYPNAKLQVFNNYVDAGAALLAGKVDYVMMDYATARNFERHNKALYVLPEKQGDEVTAMGLNKNNPELNRKIRDILNRYLKDGTMDDIISHWFTEEGVDYVMVDVPKVTKGSVLRVAVTTLSEPRCFIMDGKITGMNVELIDRIAYELGMQVEYQDMLLSAMIASIGSGKSDVIAALYETPERAEKVDFTAGYFPNPQVFIVRRDRMPK